MDTISLNDVADYRPDGGGEFFTKIGAGLTA